MNTNHGQPPPLRLWPAAVVCALLLFARFGLKQLIPGFSGFSLAMMWSFAAAGVLVLVWLFFSRARWSERLGAIAIVLASLAGAWFVKHSSMSMVWLVAYAMPSVLTALVVGAALSRRVTALPRLAVIAAPIVLAAAAWTLVRTEGIDGDHDAKFHWRWKASAEERLISHAPVPSAPPLMHIPAPEPVKAPAAEPKPSAPEPPAEWPGFRGPARDGVARGIRIATDWSASAPKEIWRRPVGPGWSSFAVQGDLIYTQEQRGDDELVTCYRAGSGEPVWTHRDTARFFESNGGPGPRGTPTLSNGRVYAFGATGVLNALDARTGAVAWSRNIANETSETTSMAGGKSKVPDWGFSSSPLVEGDLVIIAAAGQLHAFDSATGTPRWKGPAGGVSYSSPQLFSFGGAPQVLLINASGAHAFSPADGKLIWQHDWRGFPIVQPALTGKGDLVLAVGADSGTRRLSVKNAAGTWTTEERWTSNGLKPYFNDFVIHKDHVYGFDGRILACIGLEDGQRKWKGGRFGNGQMLLLPDQDLLLVLSEDGEVALVRADPAQFTELARFQALAGKTWNHPVIARDLLLVRNGEEMAAYRLSVAQ
ncbi:MAG: PQQ-binding-like beta-propeller repeat protein [Acidobacteria bacterium]|nr:PQQ-binding-like beta-propeller repeat protein [Acidobacteriota bacterium]